jgi:DNA gyrase subunit A
MLKTCNTHDYALFFTNVGKAYKMRVWEIAEASRTAKGTALVNYLNIAKDEKIQSLLTLSPEIIEGNQGYIVFGTEHGTVKKTALEEFANIRTSGILAIKLSAGDNLVWAMMSSGDDDIMFTTAQGQSIRFSEEDARPMGRAAAGVIGVKLAKKEDKVVGMVVIPSSSTKGELITVTQNGYGKKTELNEYKVQGRGGSGIMTHKVNEKTGLLVAARLQKPKYEGDLLIATLSGKVIRLSNKAINVQGRATSGVRLIRLDDKDGVTSMALLEENTEGDAA